MALQLLVHLCLLFSVTLCTTTPKILDPDLVFSEDFESGNLDQWDIQACPNGVTIVTDVARNGTHSAKVTVSDDDKHDKCSQVPTDSPRAQLVSNQGLFKDDDEYFIAFSVYFPKDFVQPKNFFQIAEFYGPPFGGSPTIGVDVCQGKHICFQRDESHNYDSIWTSSEIVQGQWRDLVFHVGFSTDANKGFVEIWDGGKQQSLSNGKMRINYQTLNPDVNWDGTTNYLFLNQYRSSDDQLGTVTIYHESVKVGTTLESVTG